MGSLTDHGGAGTGGSLALSSRDNGFPPVGTYVFTQSNQETKRGDHITLVADGVDGWYTINGIGTWKFSNGP